MTSIHRERVFKALRGEVADRVPRGEFFIADGFARAFLNLPPSRTIEFQHHGAIIRSLDLDIASVPLSAGWGAPDQPDSDRALDMIMQWSGEGEYYVFALIDGPFSVAARERGFNALLHYVRGAPHVARDQFRRGGDETRVAARAVRDAGADGIILGEDIAYGRSTYFGPQDLRDLYWPELCAVAADLSALGLTVFFHSDGNLMAVLPDLAMCGLDGLQGLEPEAGMQLGAAREQLGPGITLWGNLGFDWLSAPRTEQEVEAVLRALPFDPPGGKFIFGSSAGLVPGMNLDTVRRVYAQ